MPRLFPQTLNVHPVTVFLLGAVVKAASGFAFHFQGDGFSSWLYQQTASVVILILVILTISRYFTKRDEKKDAQLTVQQEKHEENLKEQIRKADNRMDKFDLAMATQTQVSKETAESMRLVNANLERLAIDFRSEKDRRR